MFSYIIIAYNIPHDFISGARTPFMRQQTAIFKKKENEAFDLVFRAVEEMQERISVAKFLQRQKVPMFGAFYGLVAGRFRPAEAKLIFLFRYQIAAVQVGIIPVKILDAKSNATDRLDNNPIFTA